MAKKESKKPFNNVPGCAADYIRLVVKKMRWRKKVRGDVQAELTAHFEDALKDCKTNEEKERKAKEIIDNFGDAKMLAILARRAKKRCRPLWQKTVIKAFQTFGIIIGLFIIYLIWFLSGRPKITTNYIEAANKMIKPEAVDDSQNAAPYYEKAAKLIEPQNTQIDECVRKSFIEANEANIIQIRLWLDKNAEALNLIAKGSDKPYYWRTYHGDPCDKNSVLSALLLPNFDDKYRTLTYALDWRAYLSAEDGQYEKAFADLLTVYKFGKHQKGKASIIGNLVGMNIETLSMDTCKTILYKHDIPVKHLTSLSDDLWSIVRNENFYLDISLRKLAIYDEIQRCFTSNRFGVDHLYIKRAYGLDYRYFKRLADNNGLSVTFNILFTHPGKQETRQIADAYYDFWRQAAAETPFELKGRDLEKETKALIKGNILIEILAPAPAMKMAAILSWRNKAYVESTLAIIEILRFKQEKGQLPDDLQELITAGYLKSLPMDPFSNKPLVYKKTQDGFTYYSVGQDFIDDGGRMGVNSDGRPKMWHADDGDAVFWPVFQNKAK